MPGFFRKRKRARTVNKNEQKVLRGREAMSEGTVASRFPGVESLTIQLKFLSPHQHVIDEENETLGPSDLCDLRLPCPGGCGEGSFDLAGKVEQTVRERLPSAEARGKCQQPLIGGAQSACLTELHCRLQIRYAAGA